MAITSVEEGGTGRNTLTGIIKGAGISPVDQAIDGSDYMSPATILSNGILDSAIARGLVRIHEGGTSAASANTTALQAYADDIGDWLDAYLPLYFQGGAYLLNAAIDWAARTGIPHVIGAGGEPIWHSEAQYAGGPGCGRPLPDAAQPQEVARSSWPQFTPHSLLSLCDPDSRRRQSGPPTASNRNDEDAPKNVFEIRPRLMLGRTVDPLVFDNSPTALHPERPPFGGWPRLRSAATGAAQPREVAWSSGPQLTPHNLLSLCDPDSRGRQSGPPRGAAVDKMSNCVPSHPCT